MRFREFTNPEEENYDITSSLNTNDYSSQNAQGSNSYNMQLIDLIGILEDVTEEELQEQYGISMSEYLYPTEETINKVYERVNRRHR